MRRAIVTGSGGLVGSETVAHLVEAGFDVIGLENDMRAYFFGPAASTRRRPSDCSQPTRRFRSLDIDIRDGERWTPLLPISRRARAGRPHRRSAVTRLGGIGAPHGLRHQRQRDAEPARGDAAAQPRRDVHLRVHEQGLWGSSEHTSARRARDQARTAGRPRVLRGIRRPSRSTSRCIRSSACRRRPPTCSSRSTGVTSACLRCASAGAASPDQTTPALDSTASFRT